MHNTIRATLLLCVLLSCADCATVRVTDPPRTATEQFLLNQSTVHAIEKLSAEALRDRRVYLDPTYLTAATQPSQEHSFMIGELRARLLASGVRLANYREEAQVIVEVRSEAVGTDRYETLIGLPALYFFSGAVGQSNIPITTPELALYKHTRQRGFSSVAFVAYWRDTGELIAASGPFVGDTNREDFWFFGFGPRTVGSIPPAQR
jgi:hypothetical protein